MKLNTCALLLLFLLQTFCAISNHHEVIIIGSGPAGLTAGIYIARELRHPLIFEGEQPGGMLTDAPTIENWPGSEPILGFDLMEKMRNQAQNFGCTLKQETVTSVDFNIKPFVVSTSKNVAYTCDALIIAIGLRPKTLACTNTEIFKGKGIATCALCEGPLYKNKPVIIAGGGIMALHNALFLRKYTDKISMVFHEPEIDGPKNIRQKISHCHSITLYPNSSVTELHGNAKGQLTAASIKNLQTNEEFSIETEGIFVSLGNEAQTEMFGGALELDEEGKIVTNGFGHTSIPGVFVAGGTGAFTIHVGQAVGCAATGYTAALEAEKYLSGLEIGGNENALSTCTAMSDCTSDNVNY